MPRIRTVKPSFYRHEALQDLERSHHHLYPMLVFQALWGHCDKHGVFEWKPRHLKLDILPFLDFDLADTLDVLEDSGFVAWFETGGREYGHIPTFESHQRINGREAHETSVFPKYSAPEAPRKHRGSVAEALRKHHGSIAEASGKQHGSTGREGKGIGREGNRKGTGTGREQEQELPDGFAVWWMAYPRKVKKPAALKAWHKIAPSIHLQEAMLAALAWQGKTQDWTKDGGQFIPYPASWLNDRRWEDEPPTASGPTYEPPPAHIRAMTQKYADLPDPFRRDKAAS